MLREITVATRLVIVCNPNNPTSTARAAGRDRRLRRARCRAHVCVIVDEAYCEFNLLDDPDASIELLDAPPQPRAAADVLEGLRAVRAARRLRAVRLGRASARARPGAPAVLLQRARAGRRGRGARATRTRSPTASRARSPSAWRWRTACARSGCSVRGLAGELLLGAPRRASATSARSCEGLRERGVLVRAGAALGSDEPALRVTYGLPEENARFLEALGEVLAVAPRWRPPRRPARRCPAERPRRRGRHVASRWTGAIVCYKPVRITMHRTAREYQRTSRRPSGRPSLRLAI